MTSKQLIQLVLSGASPGAALDEITTTGSLGFMMPRPMGMVKRRRYSNRSPGIAADELQPGGAEGNPWQSKIRRVGLNQGWGKPDRER